MAFDALKGWTATAKHTVTASYLAWTMDAYDFFLLTFVSQGYRRPVRYRPSPR